MMLACLAPGHDGGWVARHPATPTRAEATASRRRPLTFDPGQLLEALCKEMDAAIEASLGGEHDLRFRNAFILATATLTGLRRRNLREMRLGTNLVCIRSGWRIDFSAAEMKTKWPVVLDWPTALLRYLVHYLDRVRPRLIGSDATDVPWVFLVRGGGPIADPTMAQIFEKTSVALYGRALHAHSIRYTEATTLLARMPHAVDLAGAALGHRGNQTVIKFYDQGTTTVANRVWMVLQTRIRQARDEGDR